MNTKVLMAVFRRNFVSYFANPTGYVFICLFVFFGAIAAFWVPEFFGDNLANLDQLSFWFPFIMLVYIPSITMGIWAEERKQGTDELLLTIPAADFDIVLGKYLAAVGIFSVSLLFSLVCNYMVLNNLAATNTVLAVMPTIDLGLFLGTYAGYWLVGVAMLAIGLIASFLTHNITIGFVLGVLFNMPLVFLASADAIFTTFGQQSVMVLKQWSLAQRFDDFSRGIITAAGVAYFAAILVVMLYVSMILIGRRHWFSGQARWTMVGHYVMRTLALTIIALGVVVALRQHDVRWDVTNEKLSSLSPHTCELIRDLKVDRPVQIEAFISPSVPESYVQTRLNLLSVLREVKALGGAKVQVQIHDTEAHSREASLAERRYGIEPRLVTTFAHASLSQDQIFLNVAINCGTRKVPPVFVDRGVPIEYELVRSLCTISQQKRKKLGVLTTDAQLYGSMDMQSMQSSPDWPIIEELEREFELVKVDPAKPLTEKYDVLLAVQPSSLGPAEMDNFLAAVEGGQPTAIFEDPAPVGENMPATSAPRRAGGNPMFMRMQPPGKGDIGKLWKLLGVRFDDQTVIWQNYNPYPKASHFPREFVFIDAGCGAKQPFNPKDPISAGLQQVLMPFPGSITKLNTSDLSFVPLLTTGEKTGTVSYSDIFQSSPFGQRGLNANRRWTSTNQDYTLAAHIEGKIKAAPSADKAEGDKKDDEAKPKLTNLNVVLVADCDMLMRAFFQLREQGNAPDAGIHFDFDNVTFALNILDDLAGERKFVDIRNRRVKQRTLARIEERTESAKQAASTAREEFTKKYDDEEKKEQKAFEDKIAEMKQRKNVDPQQMLIEVAMMQQDLERQKTVKLEQAKRQKDSEINKSDTELNLEIKRVQGYYKMWAVLLPPIPPLLVALLVFFSRRAREREGVSRARLR